MLGLRLTSESLDIELPKLFKDESWKKSGGDQNFLISSSCLGFSNTIGGCLPISHDGYGIFYKISENGWVIIRKLSLKINFFHFSIELYFLFLATIQAVNQM